MTTYDGKTVIAVGLNNVVLVSTDGGESHLYQLIDTVVCRFRDVFLNAYQRCWRSCTLPLCTFALIGDNWSQQTLGQTLGLARVSKSRHASCISSSSAQFAMIAGKTPSSLFSSILLRYILLNASICLNILFMITSSSYRMFHCYRHVTRYTQYYLLYYVIPLLNKCSTVYLYTRNVFFTLQND